MSNLAREMSMSARLGRRSFLAGLATLAAAAGGGTVAAAPPGRHARACILLWMNGGPSHLDTWDPKGGEVAGPFRSIATRAPGIRISELLPRLAERADRLGIVRGMTSKEGSHERAQQLVRTGRTPSPTVAAPALGAWVARERGDAASALPPYVVLGRGGGDGGFLGREHGPLVVAAPGAPPEYLASPRALGDERLQRREALVRAMNDDLARRVGQPGLAARAVVRERAVRLARSPDAALFDLADASPAELARYGDSDVGRGCLVARRLVERGVPFVEVVQDGWDTHRDGFTRTRALTADLDPAMSALLDDLAARGLADQVVVAWMGEFGRSPRISSDDGRDHHPAAWSAVLSGGGLRGGVVHGETDGRGDRVVRDPTTVADLHATVAAAMGLDPALTRVTPAGRPIALTDGGKPIAPLVG